MIFGKWFRRRISAHLLGISAAVATSPDLLSLSAAAEKEAESCDNTPQSSLQPSIDAVLCCIEKVQATSLLIELDAPFFCLRTWRRELCSQLVQGVDWAFLVQDAQGELSAPLSAGVDGEKEYQGRIADALLDQVMDAVASPCTGITADVLDWRNNDAEYVISLLLHLEALIEHVVEKAISIPIDASLLK